MTTSRSLSSRVALAALVPRIACATAAPRVWSLKPAAAALSLAFTEMRGTLCARSLVTSVTSSSEATVLRTSSDAVRRTSASAAFTTTLRSWAPKPSPAAMVVVPMPLRPARPFSMLSWTSSNGTESSSITWYEAWLLSVPPPKAAMKPDEPIVTW